MSDQMLLVFTGTYAEKFEIFHKDNPAVYETLCRLARQWVNEHGQRKVGIRMLWEVCRWELLKSTKTSDFKLNDHLTSYYVRLIAAQEPDLADCFEVRRSPADDWIDHYLASAS